MCAASSGAGDSPASTPPSVLRSAFHHVAHLFDLIRQEWIKGDAEQIRLLAAGFESHTGGYADLMQGQVRDPVDRLLTKLATDPDFLPCVLPHCDPSLRDSVQRMMRLLRLDSFQKNRYGDESERWRQTWAAMDLVGRVKRT